jgi:hypothetical protein
MQLRLTVPFVGTHPSEQEAIDARRNAIFDHRGGAGIDSFVGQVAVRIEHVYL